MIEMGLNMESFAKPIGPKPEKPKPVPPSKEKKEIIIRKMPRMPRDGKR